MKNATFLFLSLLIIYLPLSAQINKNHNGLRATDRLIKQQVEFKNPGQAGSNKVWDFSELKSINDAYSLDYSTAPLLNDSIYLMGYRNYNKQITDGDDLIVGTEHYTMYYYHIRNDSLLLVGHENPVTKLNYTQPIVLMKYPFNYGQKMESSYQSEGIYSDKDTIRTHGKITNTVDAFGKMLLPNKDTLQLVLRIKTIQTIIDDLKENDQGMQIDTYRWYLKGYRYPIFETVSAISIADSSPIFSTAFYFPPQEHLYLENDPSNLALLEDLWDFGKEKQAKASPKNSKLQLLTKKAFAIYPNPVISELAVVYELDEQAMVTIQIYSQDGRLVKSIVKRSLEKGNYTEPINCSSLPNGNYIVQIKAGKRLMSEKFIKN